MTDNIAGCADIAALSRGAAKRKNPLKRKPEGVFFDLPAEAGQLAPACTGYIFMTKFEG